MATVITEQVLPNNTIVLTLAFTDEDGSAVTPNDPTTWSLTDSQGNTINSRSAVAITEASSVDVVLTSADLATTGVNDDGIRIFSVSGTYDSDAGSNLSLNATQWLIIGDVIKPVNLDDLKRHLNIGLSNTTHNLQLAYCLTAARQHVENYLGRKLLTQSVTQYFDGWPDGDRMIIPYGNLATVTSVTYKDTDGDWNTFSSDYYSVQTTDEPGKVVLGYNDDWPTDTLHPDKPVKVVFTCGYGATPFDVPMPIRMAIKLIAADLFEQRETNVFGIPVQRLNTDMMLLSNYVLHGGWEHAVGIP